MMVVLTFSHQIYLSRETSTTLAFIEIFMQMLFILIFLSYISAVVYEHTISESVTNKVNTHNYK